MKKNFLQAFTLIEMLIVMTIIITLTALSVGTFTALRTSIILNETSTNFQQVMRDTQRDAMLLKRDGDERWIYGIGVDVRDLETNGRYNLFKWCSPFPDYGIDYSGVDSKYSTGKFPNYNKDSDLGVTNGNIPITDQAEWYEDCSGTPPLATTTGVFSRMTTLIPTVISRPIKLYVPQIDGSKVAFIVFESISGRTFFYNEAGHILNYESDGTMIDNPGSFELYLASPNESRELLITVKNVSGKVSLTKDVPEGKWSYIEPQDGGDSVVAPGGGGKISPPVETGCPDGYSFRNGTCVK